jgi:thiol:disulfide interchange protein DsbD
VKWSLLEGYSAGELQFPFPELIETPPFAAFGYSGEVWYPVWIRTPASGTDTSFWLRAQASWLVCKEECLPEKAELELRVGIGANRPNPDRAEDWRHALRKLPAQAAGWIWSRKFSENELTLTGKKPAGWKRGLGEVRFFPLDPGILENAAPQSFREEGNYLALDLRRDGVISATPDTLRGVLVADSGWMEGPYGVYPAIRVAATLGEKNSASGRFPVFPLAWGMGGAALLCILAVFVLRRRR